MATVAPIPRPSLEEFLAWERQQPERYERVAGAIRMMTGGTANHNRIMRNCAGAFENRLQSSNCEVFTSDMKVVSPQGDVMYPDVVVTCGDVPGRATEIEAPVVIIEMLSESTAARDHGQKRWAYQTIPSLKHYVLIAQDEPVVEVASPEPDGTWRSIIHRDPKARLRLEALSVEIGLDEVFARINFGRAPDADPAARAGP